MWFQVLCGLDDELEQEIIDEILRNLIKSMFRSHTRNLLCISINYLVKFSWDLTAWQTIKS